MSVGIDESRHKHASRGFNDAVRLRARVRRINRNNPVSFNAHAGRRQGRGAAALNDPRIANEQAHANCDCTDLTRARMDCK